MMAQTTKSITGKVLSSDAGQPVSGASVILKSKTKVLPPM